MIYILVSGIIFFIDYRIKNYIEKNKEFGRREEILNGNIIIEKCHNRGGILNFMENNARFILWSSGIVLGIIGIILALILPKKGDNLLKFALALIFGGAASNVYDRLKRGYVVDYFSFSKIENVIFNISDIFIFLGSLVIMFISLFKKD